VSFIIRKGNKEDVSQMFRLVKELAEFERAPEAVVNTETQMLEDGFGKEAIYRVFVAEDTVTNEVVGMALYYTAYSTWKGKMLFLDDLVVTEKYRRYGIGRKLINAFLNEARELGVNQVRWQVLNWNAPAIEFYKSLGAELDPEWITCKMSNQDIAAYLQSTVMN
jgi:GNAT superfamily N-acetyltransferase